MNDYKRMGLVGLALCCLLLIDRVGYANDHNTVKKNKEIKHSFFLAGPQFTGIIDEEGGVTWDSGKAGARDGYVLPNGNVLICWGDEVLEFAQDKKVVFSFKRRGPKNELGTAVRLENGNTLITESSTTPQLLEVDPSGKIVLAVPLQPETDNIHMQTRMARKLSNGNYLVPHLLAFKVKEYTPTGEVVREIATDSEELGGREAENWPFTAIKLKNGNVVINLTHGNKTIEINEVGEIVWKISNDDFEENPFQDPCGGQRLPNGNTVIASYGATDGIKLFEVNKKKEMVWKYEGYRAHHFQILTTNGKPLKGAPKK